MANAVGHIETSPDGATDLYASSPVTIAAATGTWYQLTASFRALGSGDRMQPQIFASGASAKTGSFVVDDCSFTHG